MILPILRTSSRWVLRIALWAVSLLVVAAIVVAIAFQFWFLPNANDYRGEIAAAVANATGVRIEIGAIQARWREWRPGVTLSKVLVRDAAGGEALSIDEIHTELAWKSLALQEVRLHSLDVSRLTLDVRRDAQGRLFIAGLPLSLEGNHETGLGDWLLRQDSVQLNDSVLRWIDDMRGAPPLEMTGVQLQLRHRFAMHSFSLDATPPKEMGAVFHLQGDFKGESLSQMSMWDGALEMRFPFVNLAEVNRHWPLIGAIEQAAGGLEARVELEKGELRHARARVAVANLVGRMAPDLEPLMLSRLMGGLEITRDVGKFAVKLQDVSFTVTEGLSQAGLTGEFARNSDEAGNLDTRLDFNTLELAPVAAVVNRLPIPKSIQARIAALAPHGRLMQLKLQTSEQAGRLARYSVNSAFQDIAIAATEPVPGFGGMSGSVKADERSGTLTIKGKAGWLDLPNVLLARVPIDKLDGALSWTTRENGYDIKVKQLDVANADFSGATTGSYRYVKGSAGSADLTTRFSRVQATGVWHYVPKTIPDPVREWLRQALVAGTANQASIVVRGNLADFPFSHGRPGLFEVKLKAQGGVLDYVPGWPRVEDISCDLLMRANTLEISNARGRIFRAEIGKAKVSVPDLGPTDPRARIEVDVKGPSRDFLRYIEDSPLVSIAGAFARAIKVQGEGQLKLALMLPLREPKNTTAQGVYSVASNQVVLPAGLGTLEQVTGQMQISEKGITARGVRTQYLGGAVKLDVDTTAKGGLEVKAAGQASAAGIAQLSPFKVGPYLSGSTPWRGTFDFHDGGVQFGVESDLVGLASQLPAPFDKAGADVLRLKVERMSHDSGMPLLRAQLGDRVLLRYLSPADELFDIRAGELVFGGKSGESARDGLRVSGRIPRVDADAWIALYTASGSSHPAPSGMPAPSAHAIKLPPLFLQDLQIDRLRWFAREFDAIRLSGKRTTGGLQVNVDGKAVSGDLVWRDQGSGQLFAKMARLYLAATDVPSKPLGETIASEELPGIEAEIQDFRMNGRDFGKLLLSAVPQGRVWALKQLELRSPDFFAQMQGTYDLRGRVPRTTVEVKVDVSDLGNCLSRMRMPNTIKRGKAKLDGSLQWSGAPYALDLPSLQGRLALEARQGQFIKIEPGVGKLLGVLSLQALPRRLSLDFRDVFSDGFAFTLINATSQVNAGVATTQDFKMFGPAAAVELKGSADLIRETQDLKVRVIPGLSDSLTVAGAIVNPAIGLAAYLAQKVLKDPVDKLFASEYLVTGSWADPTVSKKVKEVPPVVKGGR